MTARLSVVMIVRNEAANIARCLDSIRRGVDEIVVLDTGSTDATPDIARKHGADVVVVEPEWSIELGGMRMLKDFGAARNRALSLASGTHAVIVDADHAYVWPTLDAVREAAAQGQHDTWTLWYHMAAKPNARPVDVVTGRQRYAKPNGNIAMLRLVDGPWYDGVIHETVAAWEERRHHKHGTTRGNVTRSRIADYGHEPTERARLGKDLRNILLLERAAELDSTNPVPLTYLALEYASRDIGRASALCEQAWGFLGHPKLIGAQFLRLVVARCWAALRRKDADTAWATLSEWDAREGVDHPDVLTLRGLVAEAVGMTDHARAMFRAAVTPSETQWTVRYISSDTAAERLRALGAQ